MGASGYTRNGGGASGTTTAAGIADATASARTAITGGTAAGAALAVAVDAAAQRAALSVYSEAEVDAAVAAASGGAAYTPLDSTTGWTLTPASGGTLTVASGSLTTVLPSGSNTSYSTATRAWPAGYARYRVQWRAGLACADAHGNIVTRTHGYYGAIGGYTGYWQTQYGANGSLSLAVDAGTASAGLGAGSVPTDGSLWVRIEADGTSLRMWTAVNATDDETLCDWILRADGTHTSQINRATQTVMGIVTVSEGHAAGAEVTATTRALTVSGLL